ncbi:2-dehydropantoate 2-reductase [Pontibacillus litoralis]|uniref:2-dehydropantoate 2-reductase n=1 Tax=Pontibacillus litoralis JSM 072002 TaxID=1385512 RepID=A0A0A5HVS5_9BACI|nr:2-dehydropantoate 2-reductase [Pontibacillus litoralis]KGX87747.1 2-dehydropantoate 2-reductase [Pontibacillus litoralis JSM 072002]
MKVAIAGSGALGSRFGVMLHDAGNEVTLIDKWPEHIELIRKNGLLVDNGEEKRYVNIPVFYPSEVKETMDLVFVFTKSMGLQEMIEDIKPVIGEHTKIICLLNGVGHETILQEHISLHNIFMGVTLYTASLKGPGHAYFNGTGKVEIQNFVVGEKEELEAKQIVELLNEAGLNTSYSTNVTTSIWRKACTNGAMNAICALLDSNLHQYCSTDQAEPITRQIVKEFVIVANKKGASLNEEEIVDYVLQASKNIGSHYPSMHQDLVQNHRYTEVDFLNGAVARMSKEFEHEAPYNELITQLIHAKEQILEVK